MLPPPFGSRGDSPVSGGRLSPRLQVYPQPPPSSSSGLGLRPSYASYEPSPPSSRQSASLPTAARWRDEAYSYPPRDVSPPLRSIQQGYATGQLHAQGYPQPAASRGRSQSNASRSERPTSEEQETAAGIAAGQNRRLAHLMSEQKRRE